MPGFGLWPVKPVLLQLFLPQTESVTFPVQNLDLVSMTIPKHKQLAAHGLLAQDTFYQNRQSTTPLAKIHRLKVQINIGHCQAGAQHQDDSR